MKKHISFTAEFKRVLALLGPYMVLFAIIVGAVRSKGQWSNLEEALRMPFLLSVAAWLLLSLYVAVSYKRTGVLPSAGAAGGSGDDEGYGVNTDGTPMSDWGGGILDVHGNTFGSSND